MNFYTLLPQGFPNIFPHRSLALAQTQSTPSYMLNIIGHALKISITNYQITLNQQKLKNNQVPSSQQSKDTEKKLKSLDKKSVEFESNNHQISNIKKKENILVKEFTEREASLKQKSSPILNITVDEPSQSNHEKFPNLKRQYSKYRLQNKREKSNKSGNKKVVPAVSLLSASNLPDIGSLALKLKKKKENLLKRQILYQPEKTIKKRETRQTRIFSHQK